MRICVLLWLIDNFQIPASRKARSCFVWSPKRPQSHAALFQFRSAHASSKSSIGYPGGLAALMMAVLFLHRINLVLCSGSVGKTWPCTDTDWRFAFSECGSSGTRNVYAFVALDQSGRQVCDGHAAGSRPLPPPLLNVPCDSPACAAGMWLTAGVVLPTANRKAGSTLELRCEACPAGRFSLGGGVLISGFAADWRRPWPVELRSSCMYKNLADNTWHNEAPPIAPCTLRVEAPSSVAGAYEVVAIPCKNDKPFIGELVLAPFDGSACPATLPWQAPATKRGGVILLAKQGGCSLASKVSMALAAGAQGLLIVQKSYHASLSIAAHSDLQVSESKDIQIPVLFLGRADGDVLEAAAIKHSVVINVMSPSCTVNSVSAAVGSPSPSPTNASQLGCSPWIADPAGRFVYSGDNRNFHSMVSTLTWTVTLVRDGYVVFRYMVNAEGPYDGLALTVDWKRQFGLDSKQLEYKEVQVDLKAGSHILEWQYEKDASESSGEDQARIQLIEIHGVSHSDMTCLSCKGSGNSNTVGAGRCSVCGQSEYLEVGISEHGHAARCSFCPANMWSIPGSIGQGSCKLRLACDEGNVETRYTPCKDNLRYRKRSLREPITCDPNLPNTVLALGTSTDAEPCELCQPHEWRPDGGRCVPEVASCPPGFRGSQELNISYWHSWPRNISREVWTMRSDMWNEDDSSDDRGDDDHPDGYGWQLDVDHHRFAYAGDVLSSRARDANDGDLEDRNIRFGDALLHLYVNVTVAGEFRFNCEVFPPKAWGFEARILVDGVLPFELHTEIEVTNQGVALIRGQAPLEKGQHKISFLWQFAERDTLDDSPSPARGIRLFSIAVKNAAGAGSSHCEKCPPGHVVSDDRLHCDACEPGRFANSFACEPCQSNFFSADFGSTICQRCGEGTNSDQGASSCQPLAVLAVALERDDELFQPSAGSDLLFFNVTAVREAWKSATHETTGPFEVAGRQFFINLFQPMSPPYAAASEGGGDGPLTQAYIWELEAEAVGVAGHHSAACTGNTVSDLLNLGARLEVLAPVANGGVRGVHASYTSGEPCAIEDAAAKRHTSSVFLRCDAHGPAVPAPARRDAQGVYHLPGLVARRAVGSSSSSCSQFELEWPIAAACPRCRTSDYAPRPDTACAADGLRDVSFVLARPCIGGVTAVPSYREPCVDQGDEGTRTSAQKYIFVAVFAAAIVSCCLCAYACHLHKSYGRYAEL